MPSSAASNAGRRWAAVNRHHHAGFPHQQTAQAVRHGNTFQRERGSQLAADIRHGPQRHRLIAFVIEVERAPAAGVVANGAFERHYRAFAAPHQPAGEPARIERPARDGEIVARFLDFKRVGSLFRTAADRGQERYFIAFGDLRGQLRERAIARHHDASSHLPQCGRERRVTIQNGAQIGAFGELGIIRAAADQVLQNTKKKHARAHL